MVHLAACPKRSDGKPLYHSVVKMNSIAVRGGSFAGNKADSWVLLSFLYVKVETSVHEVIDAVFQLLR